MTHELQPLAGRRTVRSATGASTATEFYRALTPQQYAEAVRQHADQDARTSHFPGQNFDRLAEYLLRPTRARAASTSSARRTPSPADTFPFLTAYTFTGSSDAGWTKSEHRDPESCPLATPDKPMILFLRGKPSSTWLSALGAKYVIDPEFFNRHLDFRAVRGRTDYFSQPALPSGQSMLFHLPYMILGQIKNPPRRTTQQDIDDMRQYATKSFDLYWDEIQTMFDQDDRAGESVVRNFFVHDQTHFALEQRISIGLNWNRPKTSWQLVIWLDTGKPLSQSPAHAPWRGLGLQDSYHLMKRHSTRLYPVIRTHPAIALKSHRHKVQSPETTTYDGLAHNASVLHENYGWQLDPATMAADPFYALYDIFHFVAVSYRQYLNMLEAKHAQRTLLTLSGGDSPMDTSNQHPEIWDSTNLRYDQAVLETYAPQLRSIVEMVRHHESDGPLALARHRWPRLEDQQQQQQQQQQPQSRLITVETTRSLLRDFEDLVTQTDRLLDRYRDGMTLLMNRAVMAEAAKSVAQAQEVTKLTRLAFVYIPLSFTAAFFGMNFAELSDYRGSGSLPPIWLWFVISVPILGLSLVMMVWDLSELWHKFIQMCYELPERIKLKKDESKDDDTSTLNGTV